MAGAIPAPMYAQTITNSRGGTRTLNLVLSKSLLFPIELRDPIKIEAAASARGLIPQVAENTTLRESQRLVK